MILQLMFPEDYFNNEVEQDFRSEFDSAKSMYFSAHSSILLDESLEDGEYHFHGFPYSPGTVVLYRGWMKSLPEYSLLYYKLLEWSKGTMRMLVSPKQYEDLHYFTRSYHMLTGVLYTPKMVIASYEHLWSLTPERLQVELGNFAILKDDVKSVKGSDFPSKIDTHISKKELHDLVNQFRHLRGKLYTGNVVFKKYEPLKKYGEFTNEYRVFYFLNDVLTVEPNSNQPKDARWLPFEVATMVQNLPSPFYTVDFAEMENGEWMVIETGDGQVSGLSPNQNPFVFYSQLNKRSGTGE